MDAEFVIVAAVDTVLLGASTGVVAERMLPLGTDNVTGAAGAAAAVDVAVGVDAEVPVGAAASAGDAEFSARPAGVIANGVLLAPIASVAVADAVLLAGSDTEKANTELVPTLSGVGLKFRPVSCATVSVSPRVTAVMPSASRTVPFEGNAVTVTTKADEAKVVSIGAGIAISVAELFSATVSNVEFAVSAMVHSTAEWLATVVAAPAETPSAPPRRPCTSHDCWRYAKGVRSSAAKSVKTSTTSDGCLKAPPC